MSQPLVTIAGRKIGPGHPPYIVAEMSGNHNGDIGRAQGVLAGAATDLSPAYRPEVKGKAAAEALFKGAA